MVLCNATDDDVSTYLSTCRDIGKRGECVHRCVVDVDVDRRRGLEEMDMSSIRRMVGGDEATYRAILGLP